MTAATPAQRQASLKARRKDQGLVMVRVWVHPDWRVYIRHVASKLQSKIDERRVSIHYEIYKSDIDESK